MTQIGIGALHGIGLRLAWRDKMTTKPIIQRAVGRKVITEVPARSRGMIKPSLHRWRRALRHDIPTDNTAIRSIHGSQDVDPVFLLPMKLNSSSSSAVSGLS